jgi:hypothetical protein
MTYISIHFKKNRCLTKPQKKVPEMSKSVQMRWKSQKKDKNIYETFTGSSCVPGRRTFSCETFFKLRTAEKGFLFSYQTFFCCTELKKGLAGEGSSPRAHGKNL